MKSKKEKKLEQIKETFPDDEFVIADGYDDAIIGVDWQSMRLIYSVNKMIRVNMKTRNLTYEEAVEDLEFNTLCAYVGEKTPIYMVCE